MRSDRVIIRDTLHNTQSTALTDFLLGYTQTEMQLLYLQLLSNQDFPGSYQLSQVKQCPRKSQNDPLTLAGVDIVDNEHPSLAEPSVSIQSLVS